MVGPSHLAERPADVFLYQQVRGLTPPRDETTAYTVADGAVATEDLRRLSMPVRFLAGEDDAVIPAPLIERAHRLVPGSRYVDVPGAGHSVYWERPDEFNRILTNSCAGRSLRSAACGYAARGTRRTAPLPVATEGTGDAG